MTAGIGLIAGMMVVGAAAGGGAFAASQGSAEKEKVLYLACESYPDAKVWVDALEMQIRALSMADGVLGLSYLPGSRVSTDPTRRHEPPPPPEVRLEEVEDWINSTRWKTWTVKDGVRIFEQAFGDERPYTSSSSSSSFSGVDCNLPPCLKINVGVNGSALDVMAAMIEMPAACRTGVIKSIRVVETINNCTDIIHVILEPIFVYPTWTAPRDFCLMRYWKHDRAGGSSVVCLDSTYHHDCPLLVGHIRADLHAVYTISPPKVRS
jgi:hypothetical protein